MKPTLSLLLVALLGCPAFAQFERDPGEGKKGADKAANENDPFGVKAEQAAWQAWLKALGPGPVFRVEVLYRHQEDGRLYYLRALVSAQKPHPLMFGLALDDHGQPLPPPEPGKTRIKSQAAVAFKGKHEPPPPPLAETTGYLGVSMKPGDGGPTSLMIYSSDTATNMTLPAQAGGVAVGFHSPLFIVERLTPERLAQETPLRQDPAEYQRRVATLTDLLLTTHLPKLLASDDTLTVSAHVLRAPLLGNEVRKRLEVWTGKTPKDGGFPYGLTTALGDVGEERDLDLLFRLLKAHPGREYYVLAGALHLAKRVGGARAVPVMELVFKNADPWDEHDFVRRLRKLMPAVPVPTCGDHAVVRLARLLNAAPESLHLKLAEAALLDRAAQAQLTAQEQDVCRHALKHTQYGHWIFLSPADRAQGRAAALKLLAVYQPLGK